MSEPIGVGLVGYGLAGAVLHAPIIEALAEYRLVAVVTSRTEAAERRDRPKVVPDIDALLGIEDVDLVIVVTPNHHHAFAASRHFRLAATSLSTSRWRLPSQNAISLSTSRPTPDAS